MGKLTNWQKEQDKFWPLRPFERPAQPVDQAELRSALNTIWKVEPAPGSGLWIMVRERLFSFGMVLSVGFISLLSLLASSALAAITKFFSGLFPVSGVFWQVTNFVLIRCNYCFVCPYQYVPETAVAWRDVRVGAIVTALPFNFGKFLLALYLGRTTPGSAYGAAGSLVVVVIWVCYSAQIFFFGAELTHVYALFQRETHAAEARKPSKAA